MRRLLGLAILLVFALGVGLYSYLAQRPVDLGTLPDLPALPWQTRYEPITLSGFVSGEKVAFLRDPQVQSILTNRYGITLSTRAMGSLELVAANAEGQDFLWPSGQEALELYREANRPLVRAENVFNGVLVLYSWDSVVEALERDGVAARGDDGRYTVDFPRLAGYLVEEKGWQDVGLPQVYGRMRLGVADPTRSASGQQLAGLLAVTLNQGAMVDESTVERHLPAISKVFAAAGAKPRHSGEVFAQYIQQGTGAYPLIVGYENQLVDYAVENERRLQTIVERTRILYPRPTVWSSHPLIALNSGAERLILALADPEVQRLAWARHGFRTGMAGTEAVEEGSVPQILGLPASVESTAPMPSTAVMKKITDALSR